MRIQNILRSNLLGKELDVKDVLVWTIWTLFSWILRFSRFLYLDTDGIGSDFNLSQKTLGPIGPSFFKGHLLKNSLSVIRSILFREMLEDLAGTSSLGTVRQMFPHISQAKLLVPLLIITTKKEKHLWTAEVPARSERGLTTAGLMKH
jgi:hypothetical protein